jgi:hypothetical protein
VLLQIQAIDLQESADVALRATVARWLQEVYPGWGWLVDWHNNETTMLIVTGMRPGGHPAYKAIHKPVLEELIRDHGAESTARVLGQDVMTAANEKGQR